VLLNSWIIPTVACVIVVMIKFVESYVGRDWSHNCNHQPGNGLVCI
jgi:hypothetical protein